MTDPTHSGPPRTGGADTGTTAARGFLRNWLRSTLRGKNGTSWRETIEELIEEPDDQGTPVASHERTLLANILRLKDLIVYDVMVPRADIVAVDVDMDLADALRILADKTHSRVPVYRDTLDDILGMIHLKDLLPYIAARMSGEGQAEAGGQALRDYVRDVLIVAPSMPVLDLLLEMRQRRQHLALVIDEFGGIDGLITIENLVEEIVGEIEDEHEAEEPSQIVERPDGSVVIDARLPIEDFEDRFGRVLADDERSDIDTLGGFVFSIAGRIPARGELLRHPVGLEFEVMEADPRRIRRLRVRRVDPNPGADG